MYVTAQHTKPSLHGFLLLAAILVFGSLKNPNTACCRARFCPISTCFCIPVRGFFSKSSIGLVAGASPGSRFSVIVVLVVGSGAENPICRGLQVFVQQPLIASDGVAVSRAGGRGGAEFLSIVT